MLVSRFALTHKQKMVKRSVILAGTAVLLGASATEAFAPYHAPGLVSRVGVAASGATSIDGACAARRSGVQLRMGLGDRLPQRPFAKTAGFISWNILLNKTTVLYPSSPTYHPDTYHPHALTAVKKKKIHVVVQARVLPANTEAW